MHRAAMPVTAVNKDSQLRRTEDNVRRPAKPWQRLGRNAVSKPLSVQDSPHQQFRLGVAASDRLHVPAAGG